MRLLILCLGAMALAGTVSAKPTPIAKKAIAFGWDTLFVNPEDILAHADLFDKTPFDGVVMRIQDIPLTGGGRISGESLFDDPPWNRSDLTKYVGVFREMREHESLRESFLSVLLQPGSRASFADDARWKRLAENFAAAAWLVKEGGLPGLLLDTEDYWHQYQFRHNEADGIDYETAVGLARQRGREVFGAVFREYPEIALLSLYFLHQTPNYLTFNNAIDPTGRARAYGDLWLPFVNGLFDVAPETARIIDGNEDSYFNQYQHKSGYVSYYHMHADALALVEPENRSKFRQTFQAGSAVYLDMYSNPPGSAYFMSARDFGTRADRLVENTICALRGTDEYTWFYGEELAFVPWRKVTKKRQNYHSWTNQTWEACLQGFHDAIRYTKDPLGGVRRQAAKIKSAGSVDVFNGRVETGFDKGERTSSVTGLEPGAYYVFSGECRGKWAEVRTIQTTGGEDNILYCGEYPAISQPGPDGWCEILGLIRMGPDTNGFRVYYGRSEADVDEVEFRNFQVYKLPNETIESKTSFVFLKPETSSFWRTATNSAMTVPIDYPAGATSAKLVVCGLGYQCVYEDIKTGECTVEFPEADSMETENVYDLTLTFNDTAKTVRTARLGLIQGLSPETEGTTRCLASVDAESWNHVNRRAVIPIPYGTESLIIDGATVDTGLDGAQGWYAFEGRSGESHSLSLMLGGVQRFAVLVGMGDGFMLIFK